MSREDAHRLLDKILDAGYCGEFAFDCFKGNVTNAVVKNQYIKNASELLMVAAVG